MKEFIQIRKHGLGFWVIQMMTRAGILNSPLVARTRHNKKLKPWFRIVFGIVKRGIFEGKGIYIEKQISGRKATFILLNFSRPCKFPLVNNNKLRGCWRTRNRRSRLAYFLKTFLLAGVAHAKLFWFIVGRNAFEIRSLDSSNAVLGNPPQFFCIDLFQKGTPLLVLALVSWLLTIVAVFAPGTLTGWPALELANLYSVSATTNSWIPMSQSGLLLRWTTFSGFRNENDN